MPSLPGAAAPHSEHAEVSHRESFHLMGHAVPSLLPRIIGELARRSLVPDKLHSVLGGARGDELHIDFQIRELDPATGAHLAACLRRMVDVTLVLRAGS